MSDPDINSAVFAAIACDWEKAVKINTQLLKTSPNDIDCLNRLGKALLELGEKEKAVAIFRKVLKISKYDSIAQKNIDRANASKTGPKKKNQSKTLVTNFLEEPGKTRLVSLVNVGSASTLLKLGFGDALKLFPKKHTVVVSDQNDTYIGAIPDDLGHRLSVLIVGGNVYDGLIKSISKNSVIVFLREVSRAKKFRTTPSFPVGSSDYLSFVREDTREQDKPIVTPTEEEDDDTEDDHPVSHVHQDEEPEEG